MKWYEFFFATGIGALTVFGLYARDITPFLYPWLRPIMMALLGAAFLTSEYMIAEDDCQEELR